ncbi:uncharacterized, partial [Tachysurus ichikawai]
VSARLRRIGGLHPPRLCPAAGRRIPQPTCTW